MASQSLRPLFFSGDPSSSETPHARNIFLRKQKNVCVPGESYGNVTAIDVLPDDVLLEIFDLYRMIPVFLPMRLVWAWHLLAHVCRKWRQIVLESPHRLKLQIFCTHKTPVRRNLCIWPAVPIVIDYDYFGRRLRPAGVGNVIAALRHSDRVCHVELNVKGTLLEKMVTVMQEPFPMLTHLGIYSTCGEVAVLPSGFLGGSAPRLQKIYLHNLSFLALPTLLLSTTDLITLALSKIPPTDYISPEAMVACLGALPRLENLVIGFQSATPRPYRTRPPPVTRIVLPALTSFIFQGASEYLEELVAHIESPQLEQIHVDCLNPLVDAPVAQLTKFVDRTVGPKLTQFRHAQVYLSSCGTFSFAMYRPEYSPLWGSLPAKTFKRKIKRKIKKKIVYCQGIGRQVSNVTQVLGQFSATLSSVVHLELQVCPEASTQLEGTPNIEWLELLRHFSAVQTLRVSLELTGHVALALEDITSEIVTEVLPSLDLICLEARPGPSVEKFVAVRQLSGHPVTIIDTETEFSERLESYISE